MKLQILIPQYNETKEDIEPLLDSLKIQQNIDFNELGVIITNDGSETLLDENWLNSYPFKVEYYKAPHQGVSATRNYCLDKATADYVMFCDADDMFYNACGLWILFREMGLGEFNALISVFIEESRMPETKETIYINHEHDATFVHGKVYRRQYLIDEEIRFNPKLTIHEDSYFNFLAQHISSPDKVKICMSPFYLWRWRDNSVCRHDPKYILKTYNNMLDSSTALVDELLSRRKKGIAEEVVTGMIMDAYFTMNKDEWINQENKEYRDKTEKRFKEYYLKFKKMFDEIDKQKKTQIIMGIKNRMYMEGLVMESITFDDWIKEVMKW